MRADGNKVNNFVLIRYCQEGSVGDFQSPVIGDSIELIPVNPVIEGYMCSLLARTDHLEFGSGYGFRLIGLQKLLVLMGVLFAVTRCNES